MEIYFNNIKKLKKCEFKPRFTIYYILKIKINKKIKKFEINQTLYSFY